MGPNLGMTLSFPISGVTKMGIERRQNMRNLLHLQKSRKPIPALHPM